MRVMVVVMVQSQHELHKLSDDPPRVNSENSMQLIEIRDHSSQWRRRLGRGLPNPNGKM
jgi:hypothetical protein